MDENGTANRCLQCPISRDPKFRNDHQPNILQPVESSQAFWAPQPRQSRVLPEDGDTTLGQLLLNNSPQGPQHLRHLRPCRSEGSGRKAVVAGGAKTSWDGWDFHEAVCWKENQKSWTCNSLNKVNVTMCHEDTERCRSNIGFGFGNQVSRPILINP